MFFPFLNPTIFPIILGLFYALWNTGDRFDGCCPVSNWEKRYSLYYPTVVRPKSLENITDAINFARMFNKQVTIIGSGHSWSDIAQPNNDKAEGSKKYNGSVALCMRCYSGVVGVNKRKKEVTVLGGTTLARLRDILHDNNLALEVFPSINEQTIAGAIATGTHGTGAEHGNLATIVLSFELVTADGKVMTICKKANPDMFHATVISLGMFGVVTKVTLQATARFELFERKVLITDDELYENFETITQGDAEYVKLWKVERQGITQVYSSSRSHGEHRGNRPHWLNDIKLYLFEVLLYVASLYPPMTDSITHFLLHYADGYPVGERVSAWHDVFNIPHRLPRHPEAEFAVPLSKAPEALRLITKYVQENDVMLSMPLELRFVAADNFWLSNDYKTPTCHITTLIYNQDETFEKHLMTGLGEVLLQLRARPHWGKMSNMSSAALQSLYPRWDDAVALKRKLDPTGMFCNTLVRRVFSEWQLC